MIVAGIMVSFLLNEWRQDRQDQQDEQQLLHDLRDDLRQDSLAMSIELHDLEWILARSERLKTHSQYPIPEDSLLQYLGPPLSYFTAPFQEVTYQAMRATRSAALIRDDALLKDIFNLYEQRYFMLREMASIDKHMVLDRMFPVLERQLFLLDANMVEFERLMADLEWRNLMEHGHMHKQRIVQRLKDEIAHGDSLMRRIEAQLGR